MEPSRPRTNHRENRADSQWVSRCDRLGPIRYVEVTDEAEVEIEMSPGEFVARLTPEGYLRLSGNISGLGVYEYEDGEGNRWGELRTAEHVFADAALESFSMVPVTDDHPARMVDAENIRDLQRGHLGSDVRPEGSHVVADMLITDPSLIEKIKSGKTELSCGYEAVVLDESGTTDEGVPYQAVQTQITGNHVAVVDQARGGPTCRLLFDAVGVPSQTPENTNMKVKKTKDGKLMLGEREFEVPDEVAAAFEAMKNKVEEQGAKLSELSAEGDAKDEDMEESEDASDNKDMEKDADEEKMESKDSAKLLAKMQAKIDVLEGQLAQSSTKIDARVNLVANAREILGADTKTDGVGDLALKKAVVASVMPALKPKVDASKSADYVDAMYEAALEQHRSRIDHTEELMALTHQAAQRGDAGDVDLDALVKNYQDGLRTRVEREAN